MQVRYVRRMRLTKHEISSALSGSCSPHRWSFGEAISPGSSTRGAFAPRPPAGDETDFVSDTLLAGGDMTVGVDVDRLQSADVSIRLRRRSIIARTQLVLTKSLRARPENNPLDPIIFGHSPAKTFAASHGNAATCKPCTGGPSRPTHSICMARVRRTFS